MKLKIYDYFNTIHGSLGKLETQLCHCFPILIYSMFMVHTMGKRCVIVHRNTMCEMVSDKVYSL